MSIESKLSGHWTDEELINSLYGVGPDGEHLNTCSECNVRFAALVAQRQKLDNLSAESDEASFEFLAAQRRAIYSRLEKPERWWSAASARRFAAGVAAAVVLTGSAYVYEQNRATEMARDRVTDAQLLQEVSDMAAMDSGSKSTEPLQGLFE